MVRTKILLHAREQQLVAKLTPRARGVAKEAFESAGRVLEGGMRRGLLVLRGKDIMCASPFSQEALSHSARLSDPALDDKLIDDPGEIAYLKQSLPDTFRDSVSAPPVADAARNALLEALFSPFLPDSITLNESWITDTLWAIAAFAGGDERDAFVKKLANDVILEMTAKLAAFDAESATKSTAHASDLCKALHLLKTRMLVDRPVDAAAQTASHAEIAALLADAWQHTRHGDGNADAAWAGLRKIAWDSALERVTKLISLPQLRDPSSVDSVTPIRHDARDIRGRGQKTPDRHAGGG
jgi:uncharacterized protein (DUF2267 family)